MTPEQKAACEAIIAGKTVKVNHLYLAIRNTVTKGKALLGSTNPAVPALDRPTPEDIVIANFQQGLEEPQMMWGMGIQPKLARMGCTEFTVEIPA